MCLAIPGQIIEVVDEANRLAKVDVAGVQRNVNIGLLDDDGDGAQAGRLGPDPRRLRALEGRRGGGARHAQAARGDGRGLRAGARGAEGERDRVSCLRPRRGLHHLRRRGGGDDGAAGGRRARAGALRRPARAEGDGRDRAGGRRRARATRCWSTPGTALAAGRGRRMRFVDEFRDAELGRALAGEILGAGRARPPLQGDGGLRRPHPLDLQVRDRRPAAGERRAGARPRLPGVRDPDGPRGRRHRAWPGSRGRDLHLLRRHDARCPGSRGQPARRQGRGRRRAHGLLAARRAAHRQAEPRPRRRLLRDRLRDHRALHGADAQARPGRGRPELLLHVQPRDDRAAAARAARLARPAPRRLHRPRPRVAPWWARGRSSSSRPTTASRSWSRASSRSTSCSRSR